MLNSKTTINEFLSQKVLAVVGASRDKNKFGNSIYREMKDRGYKVYPVNPLAQEIDGDRCYAVLKDLPEKTDGVIIVVPRLETTKVLEEAASLGIDYAWIQQGADTPEAERRAKELGLKFVSGECIFMFSEPVESVHAFHRFFKRLFGIMPK